MNVAILAVGLVYIVLALVLWPFIEPIIGKLAIVVPGALWLFALIRNPKDLKERLQEALFNRLYQRRLRSSEITQLEQDLVGKAPADETAGIS